MFQKSCQIVSVEARGFPIFFDNNFLIIFCRMVKVKYLS